MKTLINGIISESKLNIISIETNIDFAYFDSKDDFFIFLFCNYEQLIEMNNGEIIDLEYSINLEIVKLKEKKELLPFKERYIDHNLSFILVLEIDGENTAILKELNKVQENNINAKKYILPYNQSDLNNLKEQISKESPIVEELNRLSIENSNYLNDKDQGWYRLLMTLFVKIPFLNYLSNKENLKLANLSETIDTRLSEEERKILLIISENDFDDYSNIEDFIFENKLIDDEND